MNLKTVGFYHLTPLAQRREELRALRRDSPDARKDAILNYLESGVLCAATPGIEEDVLRDPPVSIGPPDVLTDGVWAWPRTLAHYVRQHHIALPDEFMEHMKANAWSCARSVEIDALTIEGWVRMN